MSELMFRPATELAAMIRSGELAARELVHESLRRIEALQPQLNAFTHVAAEEALREAGEVAPGDPRPFAGVPIAIKDNRPVAGMPLTMCSDVFEDFVPAHDAFLVRRLRDAGFVVIGKTALPEMGILPTTESRRFGPCRNPWGRDRTPGGSSGGSAAAVAAGMVPIAHGNDGGGSIRIPAACCGLVGLKPARGRISGGPDQGESFLAIDGVLSHTVADTAAVLDVLAGYEPGDASWTPDPARPYIEAAAEPDPGTLKIGFTLAPPLQDAALDPECERGAREAAELLSRLGHQVEEVEPPWKELDMLPTFTRTFGPMVAMQVWLAGLLRGREPTPEELEPLTWQVWEGARALNSVDFQAAIGTLQAVSRGIVAWMGAFDAVLTPALAQRPVPIGEIHGCGEEPWEHFRRSGLFTPYTAIVNVTGQPAISLPLFQGEDGLPTAAHLIGPPAGEDLLLSLAAQLERELPWDGRQPPPVPG